jgi:hypothetical protein
MREGQGHGHRPEARSCAQPTEPDWSDVEDFHCEDREQSDGAAEEHGEKIKRERCEDDLCAPDEVQAGE